MVTMTKKEYLAIADELTKIETVDKNMTVYIRKGDGKIAFYSYYEDRYSEDSSYYYLFTIKESDVLSVAHLGIMDLYKDKFLGERNA